MNTVSRLGLAGLLAAVALALASCGGAGSAAGGNGGGGDHGSMEHGDGGSNEAAGQGTHGGGTTGMDHSGMDHSGMDHGSMGTAEMLMDENGDYSDERFIDMMVPHHQGAVEMAEIALENSDREEILQLSRDIVRTQEAEIEELKDIKEEEFGTSEVPMEMSEDQMHGMGMMMDPQQLAQERPFDKAFIDNMIPHHQSAIEMAEVAQQESENPRIQELARNIISAQEREIAQMEEWRKEWYPEG